LITVVQESYDFSPFMDTFKLQMVVPETVKFYYSFSVIFGGIVIVSSFIVGFIVKYMITDPISKLNKKISKNSNE
jgi:hypothetical protein